MSAVLFAYIFVDCFYLNGFYVSRGLLWFPYFVGKDWFPLDVTVAWYITLVYKQLLFSGNSDFIFQLQMRWTVDASVFILYILCNLINYGKHLSMVLMISLPIYKFTYNLYFYCLVSWTIQCFFFCWFFFHLGRC